MGGEGDHSCVHEGGSGSGCASQSLALSAQWGCPGTQAQSINLTWPETSLCQLSPSLRGLLWWDGVPDTSEQPPPPRVATGQQLEELCRPSGRPGVGTPQQEPVRDGLVGVQYPWSHTPSRCCGPQNRCSMKILPRPHLKPLQEAPQPDPIEERTWVQVLALPLQGCATFRHYKPGSGFLIHKI